MMMSATRHLPSSGRFPLFDLILYPEPSVSGCARPGSFRRAASLSNAALRPASVTFLAACFNAIEFLPDTGCLMGAGRLTGGGSAARTRT